MFLNFSKRAVFLIVLLMFSAAETNAQKVYKILGVSVQGNKSADAKTIIANAGLRVGDEIRIPGDQTLNAIKQLWSLNIFSDVQIIIEKEVGDGVFLVVKVDEYPRIEKVAFEGYDHFDEDELQTKVTFIRGQILKPQEVERLKLRLNAYYEEDGFFNAQFTTKYYSYFTADTSKNYINVVWRNDADLSEEYVVEYERDDITYSNLIERIKDRKLLMVVVDENSRSTVRKILFEGNDFFADDDLKAELEETVEARWWKFWSLSRFDKKKYEEDKTKILQFYQRNGFRDAEVLGDSIIYSDDKEDVQIIIRVYEGPQYKIRNITWEGNKIYTTETLNERLAFKPGDIYDLERFNQNLRQNEKQNDIASLYLDNGYLTFNLRTTETKIGADSIDILIQVSERNQFKIGRVDITGNDKTKDKVIRRELYTVPGDFFNRAMMLRSLQQLANLQYFNVEKIYQEGVDYNLANDSTVNVSFKVEEKSSDYLNASVGYSGSFGFSGAVGVTLTNFSIAEPFSLGGGQILSFNWQFGVGSIYRTFSLGFTEPWLMDSPTLIGADIFDTRQQYIYDLRQSGATVRLGRRLRWPDDYFYASTFFRFQGNNVIDGGGYYRIGKTNQFTLGFGLQRKNVDNPIFPSLGSSMSLDAEISGGPFLPGSVDFYKVNFKLEWYKRLFNSNKFAFYTVADLGYLEEIVAGTPIQPFEFFYMGGNGLVIATVPLRGYDDRSIGPKDINGNVRDGRVYSRYTAELRFAVALEPIPLYLLTFAEAGNVYEDINSADIFNLKRSIGFGARLLINPIGLIGFDMGYGFDRKAIDGKDPAWLFHFQFGKAF